MNEDLDFLIDALHALRLQRRYSGSGAETYKVLNDLMDKLVRSEMGRQGGARSFYGQLADSILNAEKAVRNGASAT